MVNQWTEMLKEWSGSEPVHILLISIVAFILYEIIRQLIPCLVLTESHDRFYTLPWIPILRLIIIAGALVFIIPLVITPTRDNVLALVGASALTVGFAMKDYINCLFAGILFLIERPYRVGDWIEIDGAYGEVKELGIRTVKLLTAEENAIVIPHSVLWNKKLSNSTNGQRDLLCVIEFFIGSALGEEAFRQILADIAASSSYVNPKRPIVVIMFNKPFGLYYKVKAYPKDAREQFLFITDITVRGNFALRELGLKAINAPVAIDI
jgi:small conductance mechanosensitive channel